MPRRVLGVMRTVPAAGALAAEQVAQRGAEGRGALRATEAADRRTRLVVRDVAILRVAILRLRGVAPLLFILVVIILVDAEAEPGRNAVELISNSHLASSRTGLSRLLDHGPPDPDDGGPFFHGDRVVLAHSHGELRKVEVRTPTPA